METADYWSYSVSETSAGVYEVVARSKSGETITRQGIDPDLEIETIKDEVAGREKDD